MARWEPDPRGRLLDAALALFGEQGYDRTTAAQIAERAGLTKATLFRLFADKREILFQGQAATVDTVRRVVGDARTTSTAPHSSRRCSTRSSPSTCPSSRPSAPRSPS